MSDYRLAVRELLAVVEQTAPTRFRWFSAEQSCVPLSAEPRVSSQDARRIVAAALCARLYSDFYCAGRPRPRSSMMNAARTPASAFLSRLSAANSGRGAMNGDWRVVRGEDPFIVAKKNGICVWIPAVDLTAAARPSDVSAGDRIAVRMPKELFRLSPGFYMALGNQDLSDEQPSAQVRFYFNIGAEQAAVLMQHVTDALNSAGIAFRFKVIDHEAYYTRVDSAVLYVRGDQRAMTQEILLSLLPTLIATPRTLTPVFTLQLAPGLGFAESPLDPRESFGTSRCVMLAEGITRAWEQGIHDLDDRCGLAEQVFAERHVSLDAPYRVPAAGEGA